MNRSVFLFILLFNAIGAWAQDVTPELPGPSLGDSSKLISRPLKAGLLSAVLPGAAQIYDKRYLKGGTLIALEAISAGVAFNYYKKHEDFRANAFSFDSSIFGRTGKDSASLREYANLRYYEARFYRYRMYNSLSWLIGGYVLNILDAANGRLKKDSDPRNPAVATALAVVPGLGLGQFYNGDLTKAGIAVMGQVSLGVIVLNYHRLMMDAEREYKRLYGFKNNEDYKSNIYTDYNDDWEFKRRTAFRNRNQYLWYSIMYYLFWVGDAVIDAHLHDYDKRMDIVPDLQFQNGGALLKLNVNF